MKNKESGRRGERRAVAHLAVLVMVALAAIIAGCVGGPPPPPLPPGGAPVTGVPPENPPPPGPDRSTSTPDDTVEPAPTGGGHQPRQPSEPTVISWISEFGPLGPKGAREGERRPYSALVDGRCERVLTRSARLPEPTRALYEGAASACLAAFHNQPGKWQRAEEAAAIVQPHRSKLDCLDLAVYQLLESITTFHRQHPDAELTRQESEDGSGPACPQVQRLVPDHGPRQGGYPVRLIGVHLPPTVRVHFGDHRITATTEDGREAVVTAPPADSGDRRVRVWVAGWPFGPHETPFFRYDRPVPTRSPAVTPQPRTPQPSTPQPSTSPPVEPRPR